MSNFTDFFPAAAGGGGGIPKYQDFTSSGTFTPTQALIDQIEKTVRWRESVNNMIKKGVNHFIEVGPGKVLSGLVKRISKDVKISTINQESDIKDLKI